MEDSSAHVNDGPSRGGFMADAHRAGGNHHQAPPPLSPRPGQKDDGWTLVTHRKSGPSLP
jgi:hypothetical protein